MLQEGGRQASCTMSAAKIAMLIQRTPNIELVTCYAREHEHANSILASDWMHGKEQFGYRVVIPSEIASAIA